MLSPLVGSGLFVAFGGPSVAIFDVVTFLAVIAATTSLRIRAVPLLTQLMLVSAVAFSVVGLTETVIYAVVGKGPASPVVIHGCGDERPGRRVDRIGPDARAPDAPGGRGQDGRARARLLRARGRVLPDRIASAAARRAPASRPDTTDLE